MKRLVPGDHACGFPRKKSPVHACDLDQKPKCSGHATFALRWAIIGSIAKRISKRSAIKYG